MRQVILNLAVSLDGYIDGPQGEYDWCFTDQDYGMTNFFNRIDTVFMGRKSYQLTETMGEASGLPAMKTYVFSNTLTKVKNDVNLISGDIGRAITKIKAEPGKDIWLFGGGSLIASFLELRLIDEISLAVHPLLLGGGTPLFPQLKERLPLHFQACTPFSSGLVILSYRMN